MKLVPNFEEDRCRLCERHPIDHLCPEAHEKLKRLSRVMAALNVVVWIIMVTVVLVMKT